MVLLFRLSKPVYYHSMLFRGLFHRLNYRFGDRMKELLSLTLNIQVNGLRLAGFTDTDRVLVILLSQKKHKGCAQTGRVVRGVEVQNDTSLPIIALHVVPRRMQYRFNRLRFTSKPICFLVPRYDRQTVFRNLTCLSKQCE